MIKLAFLMGMALSGALARTPALPVEAMPAFNEDGTEILDTLEVTHVFDSRSYHVTWSHMYRSGIDCLSIVILPATMLQHCEVYHD
jgi:hypothetical protein